MFVLLLGVALKFPTEQTRTPLITGHRVFLPGKIGHILQSIFNFGKVVPWQIPKAKSSPLKK